LRTTGVLLPPPPQAVHISATSSVATVASRGSGFNFRGRRSIAHALDHAKINANSQTCGGILLRRPTSGPGTPRSNVRLGAVVVTVTMARPEVDPMSVTEAGETEHAASDGAPVHAKLTMPLRPPAGEMLKLYVAVPPADTVVLVEEPEAAAMEKSVPVPERATMRGLPGALSVIVSVPFREPPAVGENVTLTEQFALAVTVFPQSFV